MRTRTLLLLAVGTGLLILVAGGIQLIRVSNQEESVPNSELGAVIEVADMDIIVDGSDEAGDELRVAVTLGGVEDSDGASGFRLVVPGTGALDPRQSSSAEGSCGATTVERRRCELIFDVEGVASDVRTLRYERGEASARWLLAGN